MSPTVDEAHYVGIGKRLLEEGDWGVGGAILHPPLPYYLNSILLLPLSLPESAWNGVHPDERGRIFFRSQPDDRVIFLARLPVMAVTLLLFGLVYREARRLFGFRGGLLALVVAAFDPNLLAHGALATPDVPLTAAFFWAVLRFRRLHEEGGKRNAVLAGIALGLALTAKYSAILLLGIIPYIVLHRRGGKRSFLRLLPALAVAYLVLHIAYLPQHLHGRSGEHPLWHGVLPGPYGEGIEYQRLANAGHRAYFFGEISEEGWRAYYPVAFLVKTPVPFLVLAGMGIGLVLRRRKTAGAAWLLAPPIITFLFFVIVSRINIGLRYILPAYPFLALAAGAVGGELGRRRTRWAATLLAAWLVIATIIAYPHFLSYFNEIAGGPEGGARILSDSNIDWGQDLPGLARFVEEGGYPGVYLAYFGNADPERYGIRYRYLPGWLYKPPARVLEESVHFHPDPELVAVSRMVMHGVRLPDPDLYRWLEEYPRVGNIGHSILVYDIGGDPAAHEKLARAYKMAGRTDLFRDELLWSVRKERKAEGRDDRRGAGRR